MQKFNSLKLVFWYFSVPANAYFIQSVLPQVWKWVSYYVKKDHVEFWNSTKRKNLNGLHVQWNRPYE